MTQQTDYSRELTAELRAYFASQPNDRFATPFAWLKALVLMAAFLGFYPLVVFGQLSLSMRLALVILWGIVSLLLIFNVGHDAVHQAFSRHRWVNRIAGYTFNLAGASAYSWKLKHNDAHHRNTNIAGKDHDTDIDPFLRVSPYSPYRRHYRWQHFYWPFVYALLSLLIILVADFLIMFQEKKKEYPLGQPLREWLILLLTKLFYAFYIFYVPMAWGGFSAGQVLFAFGIMHLVNGFIIGMVFQPSHYFYETRFYNEMPQGSEGGWFMRQLQTTVDISPDNRVLSHLIGSLNANVAHHIFPRICHVHYPPISAILQKICHKHGLPYHRKRFSEALHSHVALLKKLSKPLT